LQSIYVNIQIGSVFACDVSDALFWSVKGVPKLILSS